jgi:hypothetical protein
MLLTCFTLHGEINAHPAVCSAGSSEIFHLIVWIMYFVAIFVFEFGVLFEEYVTKET